MNDTCPTVKVSDGEGSYIVINESDYNEELHKLFDAEKKPVDKPAKKRAVKAK